jgi:predicted ABC-class ATPase
VYYTHPPGASDLPMDFAGEVVAFASPASLALTVSLPNRGPVRGMGVPHGVTLITGGGFHGKSTLLQALQRGVYDHIPGDGRELVVTDANAVKIRAEDGRSVLCVDISPFIGQLPYGRRTDQVSDHILIHKQIRIQIQN